MLSVIKIIADQLRRILGLHICPDVILSDHAPHLLKGADWILNANVHLRPLVVTKHTLVNHLRGVEGVAPPSHWIPHLDAVFLDVAAHDVPTLAVGHCLTIHDIAVVVFLVALLIIILAQNLPSLVHIDKIEIVAEQYRMFFTVTGTQVDEFLAEACQVWHILKK